MRPGPRRRGTVTWAGVVFAKLGAGSYRTVDGRFSVVRDESSGSSAWVLQDRRSGEPMLVSSLRDAARRISRVSDGEASADGSTASGVRTPPAPGVVDGSAEVHRGPAETAPPGGCSAVVASADPTGQVGGSQ